MVKIGKIKVLEKSLKRSFSNVRLDVLNIKSYLEKQHDIINSEISELQSQLFKVNRELKDSKKVLGEEHKEKAALEKKLKIQIKNLKEVQGELDDTDSRVNRIKRDLSKLERESITASEFNKKSRSISRELRDIRDELDEEFEVIGDELRDIKDDISRELIRNQSKMLNKRIRDMDKSLAEVDDLKEDLRAILEKAKKREKVKKEVAQLERKITKRPFYKRAWGGLVDFFEDDDEEIIVKEVKPKKAKKKVEKEGLGSKIWNGIVVFFTEDVDEPEPKPKAKPKKKPKKKKAKKKERKAWPFILFFLLLIFGLGFVLWQFSDDIGAGIKSILPEGETAQVEVEHGTEIEDGSKEIVIEVYEGELVSIVPDISDEDNDSLTVTFSEPLDADGQWQTAEGDAGIYPAYVTVSDDESETVMGFTIFVKPLEE